MNARLLIGIILVLVGVFWDNAPDAPDNRLQIVTEKPEKVLIDQWSETAKSITDPIDRIKLCIFNKIFADRVVKYEADAQQVNDIYTLAAKEVFGDSLKGKYDMLGPATKKAMILILGEENHNVIESEKRELGKTFMAFAWNLNN
tara:strand:- start:248 stop:682 length:435 start_codon:yes stop_codon:yes gene_type:complete